jgi:Flp pilus assembly protein TadG
MDLAKTQDRSSMLGLLRKGVRAQLTKLVRLGAVRRFRRREDGAAMVEFAFIITPFLALLCAIMETGLMFFANQTLETAVADAGRKIMTGQQQNTPVSQGSTAANDFKQIICPMVQTMFDCSKLVVDVSTVGNGWGATSASFDPNSNWVTQGNTIIDQTTGKPPNPSYAPGSPGSVVIVRAYYPWPIYASLLDKLASGGNARLLIATAVFQNEPYQ